jgi:pimeloyl-ACP methyl ester carboxylesterase
VTPGATNTTIRLRDGRSIGYAEFGDPDGRPLVFFHGSPGSRLEGRLADGAAKGRGVRVVALDRPGFGASDFQPGRTILDWPDDVVEVADALDIARFAVLSISAGAPFALACAFKVPERLTGAAVVSGVAPPGVEGTTKGMMPLIRLERLLGERLPWLAAAPYWLMEQMTKRAPERSLSSMSGSLPPSDRAVLARPEVRDVLLESSVESFRRGSRAAAQELVLYARPWRFRLAEIDMRVHLWCGDADPIMTPPMGRYLAGVIPHCRATFLPGEGHLLMVDHMEEVLLALFPG